MATPFYMATTLLYATQNYKTYKSYNRYKLYKNKKVLSLKVGEVEHKPKSF
jgi:hypothetical protein